MTDKIRRELCRRYASGVPALQLAREYNRSVHTIKGLLYTHLRLGKYRTLEDIRRPLRITHPDEHWKRLKVPSKTVYEISSYGRIKNSGTGEVLNLRITFGYFTFEYTDQERKRRKSMLVHVLMARHWLKNYDEALDTIHLNHDRFNNHYRNLQQVTANERAHRVVEHGKGRHFKLTEALVRQIKSCRQSPALLAERFKVSTMQVLRVQRGDSWGHVLPGKTRARQPTPSTPPDKVARIKTLLAAGRSGKAIAALTGVTETTVSRIKRGKTYRSET